MADWYENGLIQLKEEIASSHSVDFELVESIYNDLCNIGLIDYDIEKDIIFDRYGSEIEDE